MATTNPDAARIPLNSTILVTGANGLIASWAVDKLLEAGYRVRGTVRNTSRNAWMEPFFRDRYGADKFSLIEVPDISAPGAWDAAVQDVSGIAAVAGQAGLDISDVDVAVDQELRSVVQLLEAARATPSVKAFVFTSSAWAAYIPDPAQKRTLREWSFNEDAIDIVRTGASEEGKGFPRFMAFRALLEKRIWEWVRAEKPGFAFNTVLPETVIGATLSPKDQGILSTCGFVKWIRDGVNLDIVAGVLPQRFVDTRDLGYLFVAALVTPGVEGERLFGFGNRFSFPKVAEILRTLEPERTIPVLKDQGWDQTEVPNERAESLIRAFSGRGWATLEDSVKDCLDSIKEL